MNKDREITLDKISRSRNFDADNDNCKQAPKIHLLVSVVVINETTEYILPLFESKLESVSGRANSIFSKRQNSSVSALFGTTSASSSPLFGMASSTGSTTSSLLGTPSSAAFGPSPFGAPASTFASASVSSAFGSAPSTISSSPASSFSTVTTTTSASTPAAGTSALAASFASSVASSSSVASAATTGSFIGFVGVSTTASSGTTSSVPSFSLSTEVTTPASSHAPSTTPAPSFGITSTAAATTTVTSTSTAARVLLLETLLLAAEHKNDELEEQISSLERQLQNQREAVVEGSYTKKLREASYWAIRGAMTMASIIVGLGATVANWKPMATTSFSGFIGAVWGSAVGELLRRWYEKKPQKLS
ncbi:nuclear pore complex protein NUP62-like [Punica granatum]|uniref:Nuclear pore complex protein NUP62-like n=2 Tax=Punica granatum TaxID=22663 RepID=A0A6P8CBT6_PUNGR|nr:nuclear pore complex protein NUP62-like [Punica granatum]